jgi:putative spermidine/putrescine transport system substrate-binding protein
MMLRSDHVTRRGLLAVSALAAAAGRGPAAEPCVVGCWGEKYARLLQQFVDTPLATSDGIEVAQSIADEGPRSAQLFAQHQAKQGSLDVACLGPVTGARAVAAGLAQSVDGGPVPNLKKLVPLLTNGPMIPGRFVPQMYTPLVFVSSTSSGEAPVRSWADLLQPRWKGRAGVTSSLGGWMAMAAAVATTGRAMEFEPAKAYLLKLKANGLQRYIETTDIRSALRSGDIDVGITWLARAALWRNDGYAVRGDVPAEGTIAYTSGMVTPVNAPHEAAAHRYLNAMLEPAAQQAFAEEMGYSPVVENVALSGTMAEMLTLPKAAKVVLPDYEAFAAVQAPLNDWWVKSIDQ